MRTNREHSATALWGIPDTTLLFLAVPTVSAVRYLDPAALTPLTWLFACVLAALHLIVGLTSGPYARGRPRTPVGEVLDLTRTLAVVGVIGLGVEALSPGLWVPRSVPLLAAAGTLVPAFALRFVVRAVTDHHRDGRRNDPDDHANCRSNATIRSTAASTSTAIWSKASCGRR